MSQLLHELTDDTIDAAGRAHLRAATTRRAWVLERAFSGEAHHEQLEWLGDRVLGLVVVAQLLRRFPGHQEGEYDTVRARLTSESVLAEIARKMQLLALIRMGVGEKHQAQVDQDGPLSDHLEAIIGAVFLACGWDTAESLVVRLLDEWWPDELVAPAVDSARLPSGSNPSSELSQLVNQLWRMSLDPEHNWTVIAAGPPHQRVHVATVTLPNGRCFEGEQIQGKAKLARASAAAAALPYLRGLAGV